MLSITFLDRLCCIVPDIVLFVIKYIVVEKSKYFKGGKVFHGAIDKIAGEITDFRLFVLYVNVIGISEKLCVLKLNNTKTETFVA